MELRTICFVDFYCFRLKLDDEHVDVKMSLSLDDERVDIKMRLRLDDEHVDVKMGLRLDDEHKVRMVPTTY